MEQPLDSPDVVLNEIKQLYIQSGGILSKKHVKKHYPEILRQALYYFPSWEHAVAKATE
ncbi:hypothetical protein [Alicyclobacillus dauci]|uniref:Transcriptional regulator n=1 Tax=Alicyclobacillus dauci TaxID=1475485 RepID=A0ABY6Z731_9BACL|nr:hypothetical protein [Alicyclobacillus dauci]WAH38686.1 hypothetical protein NZD86_09480 [Alicyclobacillus dauci]